MIIPNNRSVCTWKIHEETERGSSVSIVLRPDIHLFDQLVPLRTRVEPVEEEPAARRIDLVGAIDDVVLDGNRPKQHGGIPSDVVDGDRFSAAGHSHLADPHTRTRDFCRRSAVAVFRRFRD